MDTPTGRGKILYAIHYYLGPKPYPNLKGALDSSGGKSTSLSSAGREITTAGISSKPPRRHALYGTGGRLLRLNRGTLALNPNQTKKGGTGQLRWKEHQPLVCRTGDHWVRGSITAGMTRKPPRRHALYGTGGRLPRLNRGTLALNPNQI